MPEERANFEFSGKQRAYGAITLVAMAGAALNWAFFDVALGPVDAKKLFGLALFHCVLAAVYFRRLAGLE